MNYSLKNAEGITIPKELKTIKDMHNWAYRFIVELTLDKYELNNHSKFLKFDNQLIGYYIFKLPKYNTDLISWGNTLHHCIGSYIDDHHQGSSILFGLFDANTNALVYTGEIDTKDFNLVQITGKFNKLLNIYFVRDLIMYLDIGGNVIVRNDGVYYPNLLSRYYI